MSKSMSENKIKRFFKHKLFIAFLAGSLCSLAFAPFNFFITSVASLSIFYSLLTKESLKKPIFYLGFFYGFGYFLSGVYWIAISLLVDASQFAWLIPFALTLIPAALALYFALFSITYKFLINKFHFTKNYQKIVSFAICWVLFEILRSNLFTGFPWNLLGYSFLFDEAFSQISNIFGIYGLSFLAALSSLIPILFLKNNYKKDDKIFAIILILLLFSSFCYGSFSINNTKLEIDQNTKLRLVQANIKQEMKWDINQKYQNFLKTISLTNSKDLSDVKAVIWSETSVPYAIDDDSPKLLEKLKLATPPQGMLITGALRLNYENEEIKNAWNSVFILNQNGVTNFYDKHHLVPFGEYVPLQKFLPFINKITDGAIGFSQGSGAQTIEEQGLKISPLLCYEVIFSDEIIDKKSRPNLLVNLTNDAWFGVSSGPYQHLNMARMRSIEYGISLARVANTGITAFIDPFGRIVDKIDLNQEGVIDVNLIKSLPETIYGKYGYIPLSLLLLTFILILL